MKKLKKKYIFIFFLLIWGYFYSLTQSYSPKLPSENQSPIFYSNQCRNDLKRTVIQALNNTKKSLHMVMFGLSDKDIIETLKQMTHLNLSIYYDKHSSPTINIANSNVHPVKMSGLLRQKILVIDEKIIFIGSANMTRSSLNMHDNLILGFYSPEIAQFLIKNTPFSSGNLQTTIGKQNIEVWLLPDIKHAALNNIKDLLKKANESINVVMFTFTHSGLVDEIISAKERGVKVSVTIDLQSALGPSKRTVEKLLHADIDVLFNQGPQLLHHKYVLIDDNILICGSTNWTLAAFKKNRDCFVILHDLTEEQKKFMGKLNKTIAIEGESITRKPSTYLR